MPGEGPILETQLVHPTVPAAHDRVFTVGGVVSRTLSVWWRHLGAFTVMSLVVYAPLSAVFGLLFGATMSARPDSPPGGAFFARIGAALLGVWLVTVVLAVVQAGAVTHATVRHLNGERASLREMLGTGLRRAPPVVATGLLVWAAVLVGTMLLVVPGLVLMVATSLALPATVVELPGARGAFQRSLALSRGHRWPLFAAGLAVFVVGWAIGAVVQVGAAGLVSILLPPRVAMAGILLSSQLGNALLSPLPLVAMAVAYHDLRVEKEGLDTATLARVFELAVRVSPAPLSTVAVVRRTLALFGRGFPSMLALAAVVMVPLWAIMQAMVIGWVDATPATWLPFAGIWAALVLLQLAAATALALRSLRGERASLGGALRTAAARLVSVAVVLGLSAAAVLAGLSVLFVPGLVAFASLSVALAVAVDERCGPWRAIVRSLDLTRGERGRVFTALAILIALTIVAMLALSMGLSSFEGLAGEDATTFAVICAQEVCLPLPAIGAAVVYDALRAAREAPREPELARVFG